MKMSTNSIESTLQDTWDQIAISFDKTRKKPWKQCVDFIQTIPNNHIVGDFACGNGRHTIEIAHCCKKVIGIDFSINLLHLLKNNVKKTNNIELIHGNLLCLPLLSNCLDTVLYIAALHNIPKKNNRIKSLKELFRVLKKNGTALISVWARDQEKFQESLKEYTINKTNKQYYEEGDIYIYWNQDKLHIPRFYHLYQKNEIKNELLQAGFKILLINEEMISTKDNFDNYFIIVKK